MSGAAESARSYPRRSPYAAIAAQAHGLIKLARANSVAVHWCRIGGVNQ